MCASSTQRNIKRLGIIAGGGSLPEILARSCEARGIETFIIAFEGQSAASIIEGRAHLWTRLGAAGTVIKALKKREIEDLVLIGSIKRPTLSELRPDLKATQFYAKMALKPAGDNSLLTALRHMLEGEGFTLHGVHRFAEELLAPEGEIGKFKPDKLGHADIDRGLEVARALGSLDVGQAAIVQEGLVLGVEAIEGTNALIQRCSTLRRKGRPAVLVKLCKPGQDQDLDLPTIGPQTLELAAKHHIGGIAVYAGQTLLVEREKLAQIADQHKIFVVGLKPD